MSPSPAYEFDCSECGNHIVNLAGKAPFDLCATCLHLPGWMDDPALVAVLDPDRAAKVPT